MSKGELSNMVRSWDCFDTLLGRYLHRPVSIFEILSQKLNDPNFISKRINAEKIAEHKTLQGIYSELNNYDPALELQIEKENTYPIKCNFDMVSDGDVVVSDMYLSDQEILELLRYHGMNKDIKVVSTYGGKAQGYIWDQLKHLEIECHIGDNKYSDVYTPRLYGVKTIYYGGSCLTTQEKTIERYCPVLAYWTKYVRLSDPYFVPKNQFIINEGSLHYYYSLYWTIEHRHKIHILQQIDANDNYIELYDKINNITYMVYDTTIDIIDNENQIKNTFEGYWAPQPVNTNRFDEKILWSEQCSYNIPLLISVAYNLPKNIVFNYRDCVYLKKIYDHLFDANIPVLESCRNAFYGPFNDEYIKYVCDLTRDKIIIDLHGSGWSSDYFFNTYAKTKQKVLFVSEHAEAMQKKIDINNFSLCFDHTFEDNPYINAHHHNRYASILGLRCCSGTMLEKFNISPTIGPLVGWGDAGPVRKKSEHDQKICSVFNTAVNCAIGVSKIYQSEISSIDENIIGALLQKINQDNYVNTVVHSLWNRFKTIRIK